MKPNTKGGPPARDVEAMFTRISRRYDLLNSAMTLGMHHRWKRQTASIAVGKDRGPALDVATGTGDLAFELARRPGITEVIGVDFSPAMLELARGKLGSRAAPRLISFHLGDALRLEFQDDSFICATAGFALRNVENISRSIAEMHRVIRPGGRVVVLELTPLNPSSMFTPLLRLYFAHGVPFLGQLLAGDRRAYTYLPNSVTRFPAADDLAALFREAGLLDVGYRKMNMGTVAIHWGTKPVRH